MSITDFITAGTEVFLNYVSRGTQIILALFGALFLLYLSFDKDRDDLSWDLKSAVKMASMMFLALMLPFLPVLLRVAGISFNLSSMYRVIPIAFLTAAAGTLIIELLLEMNGRTRNKLYLYFLLLGLLFVSAYTAPWRLSMDQVHATVNAQKISKDALHVAEIAAGKKAVLPRRLLAQVGEFDSGVTYMKELEENILEEDLDAQGEKALEEDYDYWVIDKTRYSEDSLTTLDQTVAKYYYERYEDTDRYRYYWKGITWTGTQYALPSGDKGRFYLLQNDVTGTLIVIDGGSADNAGFVKEEIREHGGAVAAWFLTATEQTGAYESIMADPDGITVQSVYATGQYKKDGVNNPTRGETVSIDGLNITVFNNSDTALKELLGEKDAAANGSLVMKAQARTQGVLFTGDIVSTKLQEDLVANYGAMMAATVVQVPSNGETEFVSAFYESLKPHKILIDAEGGAEALRAWCEKEVENEQEESESQPISVMDYSSAPNSFTLR